MKEDTLSRRSATREGGCDVQASGAIDLYFYGELDAAEHASIASHLAACGECREALDELTIIRAALAARPQVSAPPGDDWSGFMARLDRAVAAERRVVVQPFRAGHSRSRGGLRRNRLYPWLAAAALLAFVTIAALMAGRSRTPIATPPEPDAHIATAASDPELLSISERHLERSKLVVLGMATKDATHPADWEYERELAGSLLNDTRLYRLTAEQRGMTHLAGVLRDLEIVLLQTSLTDERDSDALAQIQRLIRKRDLVEQMETVNTEGN